MVQRIYTKTGDAGETGLFGGGRVSKANARVEAYGEVDELNAAVGWARTVVIEPAIEDVLRDAQSDLFSIGAYLATPPGRAQSHLPPLPTARIPIWEEWIDEAEALLPPLKSFILPGGSEAAAALHVVRTVCRRAERRVVALSETDQLDPTILIYLNRLSDLLFVAARVANAAAGVDDVIWEPRSP
jgi:cob(I)alamin adenosyltransferase